MEKIHGLIDAPFTPFDANGEINLASIAKAIRWLNRTTFSLIPLLSLLSDS